MTRSLAWALLLVAALAAGCGESAPERPSALVITVESLRPDALGCYGNPSGFTPNLDALATEGVLYTNARTPAPLAVPAIGSLMTGLYPLRHSARDSLGAPLPDEAVTLAERAQEAGFATAAFVGSAVLERSLGIAQGFGSWSQPSLPSGVSVTARAPERGADEIVGEAKSWLAGRDRDKPFLLWLHLYDPHAPYSPPASARKRAGGHAYLGEIAHTDEAIGELWRAILAEGLEDRVFLAIASDHGEALGHHGEATHGALCYDSTLRVPLILRYPGGKRAGERSADIVSLADLYPTLLDVLGLGDAGDVDGASLDRGPLAVDRGVYFESYYGYLRYGFSPITGWVDAGGKYLHGTTPEFYNPTADPPETRDLLGTERSLDRYRRAIADLASRVRLAVPSDGTRELPEPLAETGLPDARTREEELRRVLGAMGAGEQGRYDEAIRALREVAAENPHNSFAANWLATYLIHEERCAEAVPLLQGLVQSGAASGSTENSLGHCLLEGGDAERALVHFRRAAELDPTNPIPVQNVATALERLGRNDEARLWWRRLGELGGS